MMKVYVIVGRMPYDTQRHWVSGACETSPEAHRVMDELWLLERGGARYELYELELGDIAYGFIGKKPIYVRSAMALSWESFERAFGKEYAKVVAKRDAS